MERGEEVGESHDVAAGKMLCVDWANENTIASILYAVHMAITLLVWLARGLYILYDDTNAIPSVK